MSTLYRLNYGFTLAGGYAAAACSISLSAEFINTNTEWCESR